VRFQRIRVERFGPLADLSWGEDEPLPPLVAVVGPNEAGKSALHQLLATLLYGFYPASRDGNEWAPWSGGDADIQAEVRLRDGDVMEVHRRLLASPWGQLRRGNGVEDIRNQDLAFVRHVQRDVFLQVYALTLGDLAGLKGRGWESIQDRLLVGMGSRDLRSPREMIRSWEQEAGRLWRTDRRQSRHREIREQLGELRGARREARERDRELRELRNRIQTLTEERERLRLRRAEMDAELEGARRVLPLRVRLRRLDELRDRAVDPDELEGLPGEPAERLEELEARLEEEEGKLARVDALLEKARERAEEVTEADRALLESAPEVREISAQAPLLRERGSRRGALDEEIRGIDRRIRETAAPLFRDAAPLPSAQDLEAMSLPELERALTEATVARDRVERIRDRIRFVKEAPLPGGGAGVAVAGLVLFPLGLLVLALSLAGQAPAPGTPGIVLGLLATLGGGILVHRWWSARSALDLREREAAGLQRQLREREGEVEALQGRARDLLGHLPMRPEMVDRPTPATATALARLRELVQDAADRRSTVEGLDRADGELTRELDRLRSEVLPELPREPLAAVHVVGEALSAARERAAEARSAEARIQELDEDRTTLEAAAARIRDDLTALREGISRAAGGADPEDPLVLERVRERLRALADLRREEETLPRDFPDLEALRGRIEEDAGSDEELEPDEGRVARLEGEREALQEAMEEIRAELGGLRERLGHLEQELTPDILDGEIQLLEEELARVLRERDRLYVLSRLLIRAESRFREEHQPDLLRRAEEHLARITGGRYSRLVLEEGDDGSVFHLHAPHLPHVLPVAPPLSTGTREQVYLALRLAIVDHLDEGREPLPLFLDEVLVNWDQDRRSRGLDVLAGMAEDRQIFLFTCHPGLAREVEERGGVVLPLEGP
jgi:uncharacterized protein YhaN